MTAWQMGSWRERNEVVTLITKTLHDIPEEKAQTLPFKDTEAPGLHDRLSSTLELCTSRMSFKYQNSSLDRQARHDSFIARRHQI